MNWIYFVGGSWLENSPTIAALVICLVLLVVTGRKNKGFIWAFGGFGILLLETLSEPIMRMIFMSGFLGGSIDFNTIIIVLTIMYSIARAIGFFALGAAFYLGRPNSAERISIPSIPINFK